MRRGRASRIPMLQMIPLLALLLAGCGKEGAGSSGWSPVVVGELSKSERELESRLRDAEALLNLKMSGVIRAATSTNVDAPDLHACGGAVAAIVEEISREKNVVIGRTSFKLRNPENVPPAWAEKLVREKTEGVALFRNGDGRLAALYPLRMQMGCLRCHGDPEDVPEALKTELETLYPEDQAWGFEYSGIRGYIWVETAPEG